ncbi:asparagine synthase (glutamine-hydrolyzing) [Sulfurimonas sp.]|nr:asparagine synthase (glutamine-hydrolyzing) [Sulfurimonas sp.]
MCGLFGIIGDYDERKATKALDTLSHRGPDFCGITRENRLFFAHHRLSILDTHTRSNQPLHIDSTLLSFNGEIYNYKELKQELTSCFNFQTHSDSEVILAAYKKWGISFVSHLRGMFAIAIYDNGTLYLFRDRLGKKPMFYLHNKSFIFSSEIKALVPFLDSVEMDEDALLSYLSFLTPTPPFTFFKNIKKLGAGEYLEFKYSKLHVKKYYDVLDIKPSVITNKDEAVSSIEEILNDSIELRLNADVPIASLLSGGIDSASINYYAKQNNHQLQTYTLGYKNFDKYDEREDAKKSADFLGVDNKSVEITQDDFIDASEKVLNTLDEPLNDPASVPLYLLFEEIKRDGYKVVLSGEGSDELFLGYRQYFEYLDIQNLASLKNKNWLKKYFRSNYSQNREWEYYKRIFDNTLLFRTSGENFTDLQKNALLKRNVKDNQAMKYLNDYRNKFESSSHIDEPTWYRYIDLQLFQAEHFLTKLDRVSMAHSIEARTPFLDHKLVEKVFSIDPELLYGDGVTKKLLKDIMKPHLNQEILTRKKKGFSNPYMEYLINSKKIEIIKEVNEKSGLFKKEKLQEYLDGAKTGAFKQHVWGLYVLSVWIKKHLL